MNPESTYFPDALTRAATDSPATSKWANLGSRPHPVLGVDGSEGVPPSGATDELLLAQIRDGERQALTLLFRRYAGAVRTVGYRVLRSEAEADDLVQEVFLFIFRKAALFNPVHGRAGTWIIHLAYSRAFDRRRYLNARHFYASQSIDDAALSVADPKKSITFHEQSIEGILGRKSMQRFKERLTAEQQETLGLYFVEGYTLREIAELTGRSLVNVRSHYYRGLERMRRYVLPEKMRSK